jgi:putative ABC transport system substrate-binding protein
VWRVGVLSPGLSPLGLLEAFRQGLRDLGYVEGRNLAIEWRFAEGRNERLPDLAGELVGLKVHCIFAVNTPAALAAKSATGTIPIVFARLVDPVQTGLVASFARPGGNATGLSAMPEELGPKRLELLKELLPGLSRVAVLWNSANSGHPPILKQMHLANQLLGLQLQSVPVHGREGLSAALKAATRVRAEALFVIDDVLLTSHKQEVLEWAARRRVPVSSFFAEFVEAGGLMAYGPSIPEMYRRASVYVDKILKGTNPADLPVEQPTKFEFIINLKAAKQIGLTIPPNVLASRSSYPMNFGIQNRQCKMVRIAPNVLARADRVIK